jgi:predicted RND superfamily exporter protein
MLPTIYRRLVLQLPYVVLIALLLILGFLALQAKDFALDASADSLLLEDDRDLQIFREAASRYDSQDLLLVTYEPSDELFTKQSLQTLASLRDELAQYPGGTMFELGCRLTRSTLCFRCWKCHCW